MPATTVFDPPHALAIRGRLMPGTILDSEYLSKEEGGTTLRVSKVAIGPMTEDEAESVRTCGDLARFEDALRAVVEER